MVEPSYNGMTYEYATSQNVWGCLVVIYIHCVGTESVVVVVYVA